MATLDPIHILVAPEFKCQKCGGKIDATANVSGEHGCNFTSIKLSCFSCHSVLAEWDFESYV